MIEGIWNNWLIIAFVAPMFWAFVNIVDLYFVKEIYNNEYEGAIITGFAQIIPWLIVPFVGLVIPDKNVILMAVVAGFFLVTSYFFYFKTLFVTSDATLIQLLWNTAAITVPLLAFFVLGEKLSMTQYFGVAVTFLGVTFLSLDDKIKAENIRKIILPMFGAIAFLSFSMIIIRDVYSNTNFLSGLLFYSLGTLMGGIFFYCLRYLKNKKGSLRQLGRKYFGWFIFTELLTLGGVITSQRTIDISPAVSFVAVIESVQPAFIIILSILLFIVLSSLSFRKRDVLRQMYKDQIAGWKSKVVAMAVMAVGIYLINI